MPGSEAGPVPSASPADEAIQDPELKAVQSESEASVGSADQVITDPELRALPQPAPVSSAPAAPNGQVRVVLRTRVGMDTAWQDPLEDVWESTQIILFEAHVRRSERLRFEVGVRARYMFASRAHATTDANAERYEIDLAPTAAYADLTLSDGLHLRLGDQSVRIGRFDALNPSDILSSYDLRSGPITMPEASEIAQPAVRLDWDAASWLSFNAIGLPFYGPHVVRAFDGDYALTRIRRVDADAFATAVAGRLYSNPTAAMNAVKNAQMLVRDTLERTVQGQLAENTFAAFFAPRPNFTSPQAALRTTAHGPAGELGLTLGTALEHVPALWFSQAFQDYLCASVAAQTATSQANATLPTCQASLSDAQNALAGDKHPLLARADRFELVSIDGATALGPLQLGAELAYMFNRTQLSAAKPDDSVLSSALPEHTDMAHAGLRLEWVHSDTWVIAVETSAEHAMQAPRDAKRRFLYMTDARWFLAALGFVTLTPFNDAGFTLELGGGVLNGPSYLLFPRAEQCLADGFYVEAGASLLAGKKRSAADPSATLGGIYSNTNQVFVGLRWLP